LGRILDQIVTLVRQSMMACLPVTLGLLLRPSLRDQGRPCGRPPAAAVLGRQDYIISDPAVTLAGRWRELLDQ
jgi:hypothetical protein